MRLKKQMTLIALVIGAALTSVVHAADEVLVLGVNDALTGGGAVYGLPQANAVQMRLMRSTRQAALRPV